MSETSTAVVAEAGAGEATATPAAPHPVSKTASAATPGPAPGSATQAQSRMVPVAAIFADMRLKVGDRLPIEMRHAATGGDATVDVLGWLDGVSLMVTLPRNAAGRVPLDVGHHVTLRAFTGMSAFAFKTIVTKVAYQPFGYLHLRFPERVESVVIRSSFRHRLQLPLTIRQGSEAERSGMILNIGTTGALLDLIEPLANSADGIRMLTQFELHGVTVDLDVKAVIRSVRSEKDDAGGEHFQYGVEFQELTSNDRLILGSLLWYEMHEHPFKAA